MTKATNSALMRQRNEKIILSLINRAPISRADIAKETGLTKAAVTIIADELLRRGIIAEEKSEGGGVGRIPYLLHLVPSSVYFVGINVKRVGITVGICDLCGRVICERELPVSSPDTAFSKIGEALCGIIRDCKIKKERIYKAAIVTPGPVDSATGRILNPPNFEAWHGVNAAERLSEVFDGKVIFGNVSTAAASAEMYFGAARDRRSFLALIVDEGIGSGVVTDGKLFDGSCELGHVSVKYDGKKCQCGNRGCLEAYASVPNILQRTPHKSWSECLLANDTETILSEAEYLGCAIVTASNIFDLDMAVICGELSVNPERFIPIVSEKVTSKAIKKKDLSVVAGSVQSQSLVAASMAVHDFFSI